MTDLDEKMTRKCVELSNKISKMLLKEFEDEDCSVQTKLEMSLFSTSILSSNVIGFVCSSINNMSVEDAISKVTAHFIKLFSTNMTYTREIIKEARERIEIINKKAH